MDILEEALKVIKAAREFANAVDERVVRIRQDALYAAVREFDSLFPPYERPEEKHLTKMLGKNQDGEICKHCRIPMERRRHHEGWRPKEKQSVYYTAWDVCSRCKRIFHYDRFKVDCRPRKVFTKPRNLTLYTGKNNKPPWED